jgi:amino acid transporter
MEKLVNTAFDFFAYALPGFCILASFFILDETLNTSRDFLELAGKLQVGSGIALLGMGYAVGFAITPIGRKLYKAVERTKAFKYLDKLFEGNLAVHQDNETGLYISNKFALVRDLAPSNFKLIESWHVYSVMSHNMAVAGLLALFLILLKFISQRPENADFWIAAAVVTFLLIILFIFNAIKFNIWSVNDQNATIVALKLRERAQRLAERESEK